MSDEIFYSRSVRVGALINAQISHYKNKFGVKKITCFRCGKELFFSDVVVAKGSSTGKLYHRFCWEEMFV